MSIKVSDLKDQNGNVDNPNLLCEECFEEYSANKADYFMYPRGHVFMHCGEPMVLAIKTLSYKKV